LRERFQGGGGFDRADGDDGNPRICQELCNTGLGLFDAGPRLAAEAHCRFKDGDGGCYGFDRAFELIDEIVRFRFFRQDGDDGRGVNEHQ
jgi:hypothetical protein